MLSARVWLGAGGLSLMVNGLSLWLLVSLDARRVAPPPRLAKPVHELRIAPPPPPPPEPEPLPPEPTPQPVEAATPQPPLPRMADVSPPPLALPKMPSAALFDIAVGPSHAKGSARADRRAAAELVLDQDRVDQRAKLLRRVEPRYPPIAREDGIEGSVTLRLLVDRSGRVRAASVVRASPPRVFDRAALRAARQWVFSPARYRGRTVRVYLKQKILFRTR